MFDITTRGFVSLHLDLYTELQVLKNGTVVCRKSHKPNWIWK